MKTMCKRFIAIVGVLALLLTFAACVEEHTHDYSQWGSNKTHHWKYCPEDNERDESTLATHVDENTDGKCDVCGYDVGLPHVHDYSAWGSDAEKHWKYCPDDNEKDASTEAAHADADNDGKCDVCGRAMDLPDVTEVTVESAELKVIDGKPYLIVKGIMPTDIACIKLHADATVKKVKYHYYGDNVSTEVGKFELRFDLSQVIAEETPWMWFHIYTYDVAEPTDNGEGFTAIDTAVEGLLEINSFIDCDDARYTVIENDYGLIVVQRTAVPQMAITEVSVDTDGKLELVVKGTAPDGVTDLRINAHTKENDVEVDLWGESVSSADGKFEVRFDLTKLYANGEWAFFLLYQGDTKLCNVPREAYLPGDLKATYEGVTYEIVVESWDQVIVKANQDSSEVPVEFTINEIYVDTDGKIELVVKGRVSAEFTDLMLHAWNNGDYYGEKAVIDENGNFTMTFDLSQISTVGEWAYFHIYNNGEYLKDLPRQGLLGEETFYYDGRGYMSQTPDWGQVVFSSWVEENTEPDTKPTEFKITEVYVDNDNKIELVVKGFAPEGMTDLVLRGTNLDVPYYGEKAVIDENGYFTMTFDLSMTPANGEWTWFHVLNNGEKYCDLPREGFLDEWQSYEYDGRHYMSLVPDWNQAAFSSWT